jgi:hypothetical protein
MMKAIAYLCYLGYVMHRETQNAAWKQYWRWQLATIWKIWREKEAVTLDNGELRHGFDVIFV